MNKPLTKKEWEQSVASAWSTAVEATYKDMIEKAVLEEREACAAILDANADKCVPSSTFMQLLRSNAAAIRARGQE